MDSRRAFASPARGPKSRESPVEPILIAGIVTVNLALVAYGIGIVTEQRHRRITLKVLRFLQLGVALDIVATSFMIVGSGEGLSLHGYIGFSALAVMLSELIVAWRHRASHGDAEVPAWLHRWSRLAYGWWCVAYVAGAALVMGG